MDRTIQILIIVAVALILLGIALIVLDEYKKEICRNTPDLEWYYYNCLNNE